MLPPIYSVCLIFFVAAFGGLSWLPVHAEAAKDDALILPGESIGKIKLDAELPTVERELGKPKTSEGASGRVWDTWDHSEDGTRQNYQVTVYGEHTPSNDGVQIVKSIRANSPFFHTHEGVNTQSSLDAIWKAFPMLRYYSTYQHDGKIIEVYTDDAHGISFEIQRTANDISSWAWGTCQAFSVYKVGSGLIGPLVPAH